MSRKCRACGTRSSWLCCAIAESKRLAQYRAEVEHAETIEKLKQLIAGDSIQRAAQVEELLELVTGGAQEEES